ncbi:MAG: ABC transporter substrate-binding protein [Saezia sp.]
MQKNLLLLKLFAAAATTLTLLSTSALAQQRSVAVTAITDHPSLDAVRDGVKEVLAEAGYVEGKNLRWQYQSAQGNTAIAAQIARKFAGDKPDAIVAISTPSAQTMMSATDSIPLIFTAVTDPVAAKLTSSWEPSGTNVTGVSDMLEVKPQIELILRVMPHVKRIGMVYNPAEANSVAVIKTLEELLPQYGLKLVTAAAPRTVDVGSAGRSLIGKVDVFFVNTDNNVVSAVESLIKVAQDSKIPVFAADGQVVIRGAVAAVGIDYKDIGRQAGLIILRIFNGEKPGDIAPQVMENPLLYVNPNAAKAQGLTFSEDLIKDAGVVIE